MRYFTITLAIALGCAPLCAQGTKVAERLDNAADFFSEVMSAPDKAVPQDLLNKAQCVILVPDLKKAAFVVGAKYGRGFAVCRAASGTGWGPPGAVRVEGGSAGFQIGVSSTDVLLLVMNERGMKRLTTSKFTIGAEATAAAGPVGRDAQAQTDALMTAEILSWSRSRGLFGGVSLDGATLRNDLDVNKEMYGQPWDNKKVLTSGAKPPASAGKLLSVLSKYSPRKTN
jgi:lipid-binding SYLF domain-containing protein